MKEENDKLARHLVERQNLVGKIVRFVEDLLSRKGEIIRNSVYSGHTHIIFKLDDLEGLSFFVDSGHTMFGGNDIRIWKGKDQNGQLVFVSITSLVFVSVR